MSEYVQYGWESPQRISRTEIKTVIGSIEESLQFDSEVNKQIENGWEIRKGPQFINGSSGQTYLSVSLEREVIESIH